MVEFYAEEQVCLKDRTFGPHSIWWLDYYQGKQFWHGTCWYDTDPHIGQGYIFVSVAEGW